MIALDGDARSPVEFSARVRQAYVIAVAPGGQLGQARHLIIYPYDTLLGASRVKT